MEVKMAGEPKKQREAERKELNRAIMLGIIRFTFIFLIVGAAIFGGAGTITWTNGWIYLGLTLLIILVSRVILFATNPSAAIERSKHVKPSMLYDKIFITLSSLLYFVLVVIAGLDAERFGWSSLPMTWTWVGSCGFILFGAFAIWPMLINPHFEAVVRIQEDRGHKVIDTGPYRIVRHPAYAAGIICYLFTPLILGSLYAFIPAGMIIFLIVYRTVNEDKVLQRELEGYTGYAKRTRYRLIPGIW